MFPVGLTFLIYFIYSFYFRFKNTAHTDPLLNSDIKTSLKYVQVSQVKVSQSPVRERAALLNMQ